MSQLNSADRDASEAIQRMVDAAVEAWDTVFEDAPVMMHRIDSAFRIADVNAMWTKRTGYQPQELVGRTTVDFETEESRCNMIAKVLPEMLKSGSSQGEPRAFLAKDGSVLNVLMDWQACLSIGGYAHAALYESNNPIQREQASETMRLLLDLDRLQHESERVWSAHNGETNTNAVVSELQCATEPDPEAECITAPLGSSQFLRVDLEYYRVTADDHSVQLTPREWAMLRVLCENAGRVVPQRQLLQEAWGPEYGDELDYVRSYIRRLRKKIEPDPNHPRYILLERGMGYRLVLSD